MKILLHIVGLDYPVELEGVEREPTLRSTIKYKINNSDQEFLVSGLDYKFNPNGKIDSIDVYTNYKFVHKDN